MTRRQELILRPQLLINKVLLMDARVLVLGYAQANVSAAAKVLVILLQAVSLAQQEAQAKAQPKDLIQRQVVVVRAEDLFVRAVVVRIALVTA